MAKHIHEFRDPIHNFIHVTSEERKVINTLAFQRLRHIHQLATTYLIYPSATHRTFTGCNGTCGARVRHNNR